MLGIGCHDWPPVLMGVACALAAFVIVIWARSEEVPLPKWHWGDARRNTTPDHDSMADHVIGSVLSVIMFAYIIDNPLCG